MFVECMICGQLFFTETVDNSLDVSIDELYPEYAYTANCPVCKREQIVEIREVIDGNTG